MNSGSYSFTNPLQENPVKPKAKKVIVYTGPKGSGKTWQAQAYARMHYNIDDIAKKRILWSDLKMRLNLYNYISSGHIEIGFLFIDEYDINDDEYNSLIADLLTKGFTIILCSQQDPAITLPPCFQVIHCKYARRKEVAHD